MKRRFTAKMLLAGIAVTPLATMPMAPATAQSVTRPSQDIVLSIGRGELVSVPGTMADVFVANDAIADVQIKSQRQLYVFGKAGGETTIYASNAAGAVVWSANIRVGSNIGSIDQMLTLAMPEAKVSVSTMSNNTILLTGTVAAPEDAAEAQRLVEAFVGEGTNVISRLRTATPLQVNLHVKFAEVSRQLIRSIQGNLTTRDQSNGFQFGAQSNNAGNIVGNQPLDNTVPLDPCAVYDFGCTSELRPYDYINQRFVTPRTSFEPVRGKAPGLLSMGGKLLGFDLLATFNLGEQIGLVTTLAEPNLTALSGETADFLAGGEFPIPQSQGLGTTTVEYKNFGVSLSYTPTVLANGRISLRVRPEVSELSTRGSVQVNGFQIPALTTRRAETTVELGSGQSFMIAGLMQNSSQNVLEKTPGAGDIPIIGNLFRSKSYQKGETELVIIVTPYLVKPVNANDIVLPTDGYKAPNEIQSIVGYMESSGKDGEKRPVPTSRDNGEAAPGMAPPAPGEQPKGQPAAAETRRSEPAPVAKPGFSFK